MRLLIVTLILLCVTSLTYAQISIDKPSFLQKVGDLPVANKTKSGGNVPIRRTCYTDTHSSNLQDKYSDYLTTEAFENRIRPLIQAQQTLRINEDVLRIPVVVHVVHKGESVGNGSNISFAQVQSQIDVLNEDFRRTGSGTNSYEAGADTNIEFVLAVYGPDGQELGEPGVNRVEGAMDTWTYNEIEINLKPETIWDPTRYFNIWTLAFGGDDSDLLGYAQFPNFSDLDGLERSNGVADTDGVVIGYSFFGRTGNVSAPYDKGRTATHEVGHWLGLRHIWGDGGCNVDDFCADTPNAGQPNYSCFAVNSCNDGAEDKEDMIENYMDYTPDGCMNIFTVNQKERMRTVLTNSPRRKELIQSGVGDATDKPIADFNISIGAGCVGTTVDFMDNSFNNPVSWEWNFYDPAGNNLGTFYSQNPTLQFNSAGVFSVELIVSNGSGSNSVLKEGLITIVSDVLSSSMVEDVEDENTLLDNWIVVNQENDRGWLYTTSESAYGVGTNSLIFDNYSADTDPTGFVDALITPALDLTGGGAPYISFDHAYATYGEGYEDTLQIAYSLDCGLTWNLLLSTGGQDLATSAPTEDPFEPTNEEWASTEISLSFLEGEPSVHIAFINVSGWGNLLYLDNISFNYVQVDNPAQAAFTSNKIKICEGDLIQYQDLSSETPESWTWTFEGGSPASSSIQHPRVTYMNEGFYDASLLASNDMGGTTITENDYIEVVALPSIVVEGPQQVCEGDEITLSATGGSNIQWLSRGSVVFEGSNYTLTLFDDLDLEIVGENELGCTGKASYKVTISPIPDMEANSNVAGLCEPGSVALTASGASTYEWYSHGNFLGEGAEIEMLLEQSTTFEVIGYSADGLCHSNTEVPVELYNAATPEIFLINGILNCSAAQSYQWYFNNEKIEGEIFQSFTPNVEGEYVVETIDQNGCAARSEVFVLEITSIGDLVNKFSFYPNPARDQLYVRSNEEVKELKIFSASGQLMKSLTYIGSTETTIDVKNLKNGLYFIEIINSSGVKIQSRFIKD